MARLHSFTSPAPAHCCQQNIYCLGDINKWHNLFVGRSRLSELQSSQVRYTKELWSSLVTPKTLHTSTSTGRLHTTGSRNASRILPLGVARTVCFKSACQMVFNASHATGGLYCLCRFHCFCSLTFPTDPQQSIHFWIALRIDNVKA